ncbi:MAG: electron transfer flavoprotein subunit alpha [Bacillota bacterium]
MQKLTIKKNICTGCGDCVEACPFSAIKINEHRVTVLENCRLCGICVKLCPVSALVLEESNSFTIDQNCWKGILVFIQQFGEYIHPISYEMLGKAHELAEQCGEEVYAVSVGYKQNLSSLAGCGICRVYVYDALDYRSFREDLYGKALCDCVEQLRPSIMLLGATFEARSLAPYVAVRFSTGLTADCTNLYINDSGILVQVRPAFGGNIMAQIVTTHTRPQMATVRYQVMEAIKPLGGMMPEIYHCQLSTLGLVSNIQILEHWQEEPRRDILGEKLLVVIGRGIACKEDIPLFAELAESLGGGLACSRSLVVKGWMPIEKQIGLSGKTVRPDVLITCGVSGSVQFLAGMSSAKEIFSINSDPNAPIFSVSHWSVVGDMYEIVPILLKKLKQRTPFSG